MERDEPWPGSEELSSKPMPGFLYNQLCCFGAVVTFPGPVSLFSK